MAHEDFSGFDLGGELPPDVDTLLQALFEADGVDPEDQVQMDRIDYAVSKAFFEHGLPVPDPDVTPLALNSWPYDFEDCEIPPAVENANELVRIARVGTAALKIASILYEDACGPDLDEAHTAETTRVSKKYAEVEIIDSGLDETDIAVVLKVLDDFVPVEGLDRDDLAAVDCARQELADKDEFMGAYHRDRDLLEALMPEITRTVGYHDDMPAMLNAIQGCVSVERMPTRYPEITEDDSTGKAIMAEGVRLVAERQARIGLSDEQVAWLFATVRAAISE